MAFQSRLVWVAALAGLAYFAPPAGAQTPGPSPQGGASGQTQADGQVGFRRQPQLTLQDQLHEGSRIVSRMDQTASGIRKQLEQARAQRDVVKTLCLNDKLSQVDVAVRSARDRLSALQGAVSRGDVELSNHEFTILSVLHQRSDQLSAEGAQCIGEESAFIGQSIVTTTVDPTLPPDDTTDVPPSNPTVPTTPPVVTTSSI
jgi:hypothetical protein